METRIVQLQSNHLLNLLWKRRTCGLYDIRAIEPAARGVFAIISRPYLNVCNRDAHTFAARGA